MKTIVTIDDAILRDAQAFAAKEGMSLTRLVEEGLRMRLKVCARRERTKQDMRVPVSSCTGGLLPGVDPCSNASMLDAADRA